VNALNPAPLFFFFPTIKSAGYLPHGINGDEGIKVQPISSGLFGLPRLYNELFSLPALLYTS
jgi:hypothetical protein